jgi:hypothetical protein
MRKKAKKAVRGTCGDRTAVTVQKAREALAVGPDRASHPALYNAVNRVQAVVPAVYLNSPILAILAALCQRRMNNLRVLRGLMVRSRTRNAYRPVPI